MSRIILSLLIGLTFITSAYADDGSSGCGLGWQVTKRNSLLSSVIRNYTNVLGLNTSGMTSGTSGCAKHTLVKNERATEHFVEGNYNTLMVDMAKGEGESVIALGYVMGCDPASLEQFSSMTRTQYEQIFTSDEVAPQQVIQNVKTQLSRDPKLAVACNASLS